VAIVSCIMYLATAYWHLGTSSCSHPTTEDRGLSRGVVVKIPSGWLFFATTMQLILEKAIMATASLSIVSGGILVT
jgi:hypothetical protein